MDLFVSLSVLKSLYVSFLCRPFLVKAIHMDLFVSLSVLKTLCVGALGRVVKVTDLKSLSPPLCEFESWSGEDFIMGSFSSRLEVRQWFYPDICLWSSFTTYLLDIAIMTINVSLQCIS